MASEQLGDFFAQMGDKDPFEDITKLNDDYQEVDNLITQLKERHKSLEKFKRQLYSHVLELENKNLVSNLSFDEFSLKLEQLRKLGEQRLKLEPLLRKLAEKKDEICTKGEKAEKYHKNLTEKKDDAKLFFEQIEKMLVELKDNTKQRKEIILKSLDYLTKEEKIVEEVKVLVNLK